MKFKYGLQYSLGTYEKKVLTRLNLAVLRRYFIFKVLENSKQNTKSSIMHEEYPLYPNVLCWSVKDSVKKGAYMLSSLGPKVGPNC